MKDEIRVTVVATGVRQDKVEKVSGIRQTPQPTSPSRPQQVEPNREVRSGQFERNFDMTETVDIPAPSRQRTDAPKGSAFGDWDIRRENIVRQTEPTSTHQVDRYVDSSSDDDELETPPFFRNR